VACLAFQKIHQHFSIPKQIGIILRLPASFKKAMEASHGEQNNEKKEW
jgi:hypothetical protein